jgi:hypothetical protein
MHNAATTTQKEDTGLKLSLTFYHYSTISDIIPD